jgi:CRISPR-associated exonuclease Cas4
VVTTDDGEVFPVDYKLAKAVGSNHRQQLAAYGLLLEEATGQNVTRGFIYLIPKRQTVMVKLTEGLKQRVIDQLGAMRRMIVEERMPAAVTERAKCSACEFRRFCNDV